MLPGLLRYIKGAEHKICHFIGAYKQNIIENSNRNAWYLGIKLETRVTLDGKKL